jgi:hypothetical protein
LRAADAGCYAASFLEENMPNERLLLDIRYYESAHENVAGTSLPGEPGRIFHFPVSIHPMGARIARKLREFGFVAGVFDHLYVNFTTLLPAGQYRYSPREVEERIKYVDFGLSAETTDMLSDTEKESLVLDATFNILKFVTGNRQARFALVQRVFSDVKKQGSELEILHKQKEAPTYSVTVTYKIRPNGNQSVGLIEYHDKLSGIRFKSEFVKLKEYEDIFALVGSIAVLGGRICLRPRKSYKASLYTRTYEVPIEIAIGQMNVA